MPEDWQGRSIGELDIRRRYGVNILGVKRENKTDVNISPETVLDADMTLLVLGENQKLKKHFRLYSNIESCTYKGFTRRRGISTKARRFAEEDSALRKNSKK